MVYNERVSGETCLVLLEKLCLLAQDSTKHLSLQVAVDVAHGGVIDSVTHELQHCTRKNPEKKGGQGVFREQTEGPGIPI